MRALILATLIAAASTTVSAADSERNKQLYRDYLETVVNKRNPDAAGRYFAEGMVEHNPNLPQGLAGRRKFLGNVLTGFSDYHGEIQAILAEGDGLVVRVLWTGTQDGPFLGQAASGRKLRFTTADFFRIENGKIAEHWDVVDSLAYTVALGLVSPPKTPLQPAK
jgi:predicted ester cyclase